MNNNTENTPLVLRYAKPAENWESEALPIGNGFIGAMIFGDTACEKIILNDHSLWSGGPGADKNYNGGFKGTPDETRANLRKARRLLQEKMNAHTADNAGKAADYLPEDTQLRKAIEGLTGERKNFGAYQMLGLLTITDITAQSGEKYEDYERTLNLDKSYARVTYRKNSVKFSREHFVSYPGNGFVTRLFSDTIGAMNFKISFETPHKGAKIFTEADTVWVTGSPSGHGEGSLKDAASGNVKGGLKDAACAHGINYLKFAAAVKVLNVGGAVNAKPDGIYVTGAESITLLYSSATNYLQCMDDSFNYFSALNPADEVLKRINAAALKSFETLYEEHFADYSNLYNRVKLSINGGLEQTEIQYFEKADQTEEACHADEANCVKKLNQTEEANQTESFLVPAKTTDILLSGYAGRGNTPEEDLYLETLYYQYGRYLLISSSREGSLPANLQGIWSNGLTPPWDCDYHTNINVQMNYWLSQQTNLAECRLSAINYYKSLIPRGKIAAKHCYEKPGGGDVRGFVFHHENNIWGNAGPGTWYEAFYFPAGAAWCCQDIWEYYAFTKDEDFLRENFSILKDAALFWVDNLWTDERDGTLNANPSFSPEHGMYSIGASCDQEIIFELFQEVIKASGILKIDTPEIDEIKAAKAKLFMPAIGKSGQLMEWKDELLMDITGDNHHRHANHLYLLHPGSQIIPGRSEKDNAFANAAKVTLETRGDGGTGWSKAWKINFWARLCDGNRAHKLLREQLITSTTVNMFDTHPPFQIDGNFGATAGMTEMLLQSHGDVINILPALPDKWKNGCVSGLRARGGLEVGIAWENGAFKSAEVAVVSGSGGDFALRFANAPNASNAPNAKNVPAVPDASNLPNAPNELNAPNESTASNENGVGGGAVSVKITLGMGERILINAEDLKSMV
ncbi:MAG: glycoside hydrolase family 95 protein [Clostridiales bacterium]|jgi:alpha-L-fucosidase 2|nr:glycoside hydrolase family 95 protein [Clostridiales bacterium]